MEQSSQFTFVAEVKKVEAKKLVSLDVSYQTVLQTDDMKVLTLGTLDGDKMVKVTIEVME